MTTLYITTLYMTTLYITTLYITILYITTLYILSSRILDERWVIRRIEASSGPDSSCTEMVSVMNDTVKRAMDAAADARAELITLRGRNRAVRTC